MILMYSPFRGLAFAGNLINHSLFVLLDAGYFSEDAEKSASTAKQIGKSAAARGYMPDQGDGSYTVTR